MKRGRFQAKDLGDAAVLRAVLAFHERRTYLMPDEQFATVPAKVVAAKMQSLHRRGLIEYGVSLRTAWITPAGREVIR